MEMVDSTVGSSIVTGWNRRSRAASFSMVLRYSSAERFIGEQGVKTYIILLTCSCTDKLQASGQSRFNHLTSINTPFGLAKVEERVWVEKIFQPLDYYSNGVMPTYELRQ
jgi:hypothetical protein